MAKTNVVLDAGVVTALLDRGDQYHEWALDQAMQLPPPWLICEAALTESFHLLRPRLTPALINLLRRGDIKIAFNLAEEMKLVLALMEKYADVPMSLADACLVRMTEIFSNPVILTTDSDFRVYRRHGRQVVPCRMP